MRKPPAKQSKCYVYEAKKIDNLYYAMVTNPFKDEALISEEGFETPDEAIKIARTILDSKMDEVCGDV
jgi:hypothetical protein